MSQAGFTTIYWWFCSGFLFWGSPRRTLTLSCGVFGVIPITGSERSVVQQNTIRTTKRVSDTRKCQWP